MKATPQQAVVAVIPARYASERLPGKPLADIGGKPMIQHVYERAAEASLVNEVLVATDDERIADAVRSFGGDVVVTPADIKSGSDRIAFVSRSIQGADIIVNVQGDEPFIPPAMIDEAIRPLLQDRSITTATLIRKIDTEADLSNPNIPKVVVDSEGMCLYFSRSPIPYCRDGASSPWLSHHVYYRHIGLYVYRREFLLRFARLPQTPLELAENLEQLRILESGFQIKAVVTMHNSISVDTPDDLERVRKMVTPS
jgi:3-deoxy-manno-octulosonate cytidylyltransferase (CMP-KDO synthetase)